MIRILTVFLSLLVASPVFAHSLRVFAKVNGGEVIGYAFFIGGGRPSGVAWTAKMDSKTVASGVTDREGGYKFAAPNPLTGELIITVDTQEGHIATAKLSPERFGKVEAATTPDATASVNSAPSQAPTATSGPTVQVVEEAVERQVGPLLERLEAMDARMRFTDIMSGIFLIIGLAGIGLWARSRKS